MTGFELINKLLLHDLNKKVVIASYDTYEHNGETILFQTYDPVDDITGVELNSKGEILILD